MPTDLPDPREEVEDNPALSNVIERNIRTIIRLRREASEKRTGEERLADGITAFSGRMAFVYAHGDETGRGVGRNRSPTASGSIPQAALGR